MKRILGGIAGLILGIAIVAANSVAQTTTFKGEIVDEKLKCIDTPAGASGAERMSCVLNQAHFVDPPSKFVLYNAATKTAYQLDDQNAAQPFAGTKVVVTGTLDAATKSIKVKDVKVDDAAYKPTAR
jgi:hypothetical protein